MFKNKQSKALLAIALLTAGGTASAALPQEAADAFTALATYVTDTLAAVWPIAVALTVGFVGIKLFKKAANKAT